MCCCASIRVLVTSFWRLTISIGLHVNLTVPALSIQQLRKTYSAGVEALKGVDLRVEPGEFFALLGPNGAGKSTLIGILTGLVNKTSGTVRVFDQDLDVSPERVKAQLGVMTQEFNFNIFENCWNTVVFQAG